MRLRELNELAVGDLVRFDDGNRLYKILVINAETHKDHRSFVLGRIDSSPTSPIKVPDWALLEAGWQRFDGIVCGNPIPPLEELQL